MFTKFLGLTTYRSYAINPAELYMLFEDFNKYPVLNENGRLCSVQGIHSVQTLAKHFQKNYTMSPCTAEQYSLHFGRNWN